MMAIQGVGGYATVAAAGVNPAQQVATQQVQQQQPPAPPATEKVSISDEGRAALAAEMKASA